MWPGRSTSIWSQREDVGSTRNDCADANRPSERPTTSVPTPAQRSKTHSSPVLGRSRAGRLVAEHSQRPKRELDDSRLRLREGSGIVNRDEQDRVKRSRENTRIDAGLRIHGQSRGGRQGDLPLIGRLSAAGLKCIRERLLYERIQTSHWLNRQKRIHLEREGLLDICRQ